MENKRNAIALPHIGRAIATTFLFIFILCTSCFASEWNLSYEKELYKKNVSLFSQTQNTGTNNIVGNKLNLNIADTIFDTAENIMQQNNYDQSVYKYCLADFRLDNEILLAFSYYVDTYNQTKSINFGFNNTYPRIVLRFNISNIDNITYTVISNNSSKQYVISENNTEGFYLSNYLIGNSANWTVFNYSPRSRYGKNYSSTSVGKFNPTVMENNYIINKEFDVGNNYNYDIEFYYYDNEEKVYITDYVTVSTTNYWWGKTYQPYISLSNMSNIPNDRYFYYDLSVSGIIPNYTNTVSDLAFITSSHINTPEVIPPENVPPEDSGGGGDSGGSNVDLSTIETGIDNLNTTTENISATTTEISNKIDNIETSITEVPTETIENTEITADDLTEAIGVEFESDPYQNMWTTITNGLSNALTTGNRTLNITFKNKTYTINLDNFTLQIPNDLKVFIGMTTTVFLCWKMFKWIKQMIEIIESGNIDIMLQELDEDGIVFLF